MLKLLLATAFLAAGLPAWGFIGTARAQATQPAATPAPTPATATPPAVASAVAPAAAPAVTPGIALFGTPALPPNFTHFPYANPNAPKGGEVVLGAVGSFDSFNPFILRGTAAAEISRVYDTLMRESADEPSTAYGHLAGEVVVAPDRLSVAFTLRPQARFQDGTPVTAADVVWTFETLRKYGRPQYRQYYGDVTDVTVEGTRKVVFHFKSADNRELPLILGELPVLPEHWWKGRDFSHILTDPPMGSGPYRLAHFDFGRETVLERDPNYWAQNLPTAKGLSNFDKIRTEYYRDSTVAMEAFKAGQIDFRRENISKNWATGYDFPAARKGLVKHIAFRDHLPTGMQGWVMNTRRPVFANRLVREAMDEVFDFQWTNKNLFYGAYTRTDSYYSNSPLASSGLPGPAELALLDPYRAELPAAVFDKPFSLPVTDGSGNNRAGMMAALKLLERAGWHIKERKLVDAAGAQMHFVILVNDPTIERVATPYARWLQRLGIDVQVRTVDPAQYQHLTDAFDFDMTMEVLPESDFPGNEQRDYFGCTGAKAPGSMNLAGVCDPAVDALVQKVITAPDPASLTTAAHALDRVLLNGWYMVPNWYLDSVWAAYWDMFGHPAGPVRSGLVFDAWWVDPARAAAIAAARRGD
jgi:microcin C transport system substrate-binding protein